MCLTKIVPAHTTFFQSQLLDINLHTTTYCNGQLAIFKDLEDKVQCEWVDNDRMSQKRPRRKKMKGLKDFVLWSYDIKNNIYNMISLYFYSLN